MNGQTVTSAPTPIGPSLPCQRPPWSKLIAVNANTGQIVWESALGLNEALPAGKQLVGNSGSAGPTVTAGGLVFVGATNDGRFRAFDAKTGKEAWVVKLPPGAERQLAERQCEPDELSGQERQAARGRRRRQHAGRLRAAVTSRAGPFGPAVM